MTSVPAAGLRPPFPPGWRLRADPSARLSGNVLVGGAPLRVLTLRPAGARLVGAWFSGEPVGAEASAGSLARRLLDAGIAHPEPKPGAALAELTVVLPVRNRADELRRCLASVDPACPVIVIDDASHEPAPVAAAAAAHGAELMRLDTKRGPSAARNAGLTAVATPFVAFVDSDCVLTPGLLRRLLDHLGDPALAAVAPRVVALRPQPGLLGTYETHHSPLDMGSREALIAPRTPVPYAPSATLVARVGVLGDGFDEAMAMGEDVDLLWRLHNDGWQARYDPSVAVGHDHRVRPRAWFVRRIAYDVSNAALERRHPGDVPAVRLSRAGAACWTATLTGHPAIALAVTAASAATVRARLAARVPGALGLAGCLVVRGHAEEGARLGRAVAGPWLPLTVLAATRRPAFGRRLAALAAAGIVLEWAEDRHEPTPFHLAGPRLVGDVARCLGVWTGCVRHRTAAPLALRIG